MTGRPPAARHSGRRAGLLPEIPDLPACLAHLVRQIPAGRVTTFGRLALALGDVQASRWVARWLSQDPRAGDLPAYRVVLRDGLLGGRDAGQVRRQSARLRAEGVPVHQERVDLAAALWDEFVTARPLKALQQAQEELARHVSAEPPATSPRWIGGVDLSYRNDGRAVAACTVVDSRSGELVWSVTRTHPVRFPYLTGYLSFRELPLHLLTLEAARKAGHCPEFLLVDGSGILHPRGAGIATHLGVLLDIPTIGITKKHLSGKRESALSGPVGAHPVTVDGTVRGWAVPVGVRSRQLFVSPGHRCDVLSALTIVQTMLRGRALPEPVWWADTLSRNEARQA